MRLSEIISRDLPLVRRGSDRYWTSPAHDSLIVDDVKAKWHWHSRDKWGDATDWLVYWRNIPLEQARAVSAEPWAKTAQYQNALDEGIVADSCANLHNPSMFPAVAYLEKRGISMQTAEDYNLGYKRGKIVIPNYSQDGRLVGIRYRLMHKYVTDDGHEVRYFSEKGSQGWWPYGLWKLPPNGGYICFVTEGEFKALVVRQMGQYCIDYKGSGNFPIAQTLRLWDRVVFLRDTRDLGGIVIANRVKKAVRRIEIQRMPKPYKAIDDFYVGDRQNCQEFIDRIVQGG